VVAEKCVYVRPLEFVLCALNAAAFIALLRPRTHQPRVALALSFSAFLLTAIQCLIDDARWQMIPAYALSIVLCLVSCTTGFRIASGARQRRHSHRIWRRIVIGLGVAVLMFAALLPIVLPVFRLPAPTGPYAIGTVTYQLIDTIRPELFTRDSTERRELMMQVWYPAKPTDTLARARYVKNGVVLAPLAALFHLPQYFFTHLRLVQTNAVVSAPLASGAAAYPVLIFSHGRAGFRQHNSFQVEELVSHGYIVAAIDHSYAAAGVELENKRRFLLDPRMRDRKFVREIIPYLAQDVSFAIDQLILINRQDPRAILTGALDVQRMGAFGVSMGGFVIAESCLRDARIKACLSMDAFMPPNVVRDGLTQPIMFLSRDANSMRREGWAEADVVETQSTTRIVFDKLSSDGYLVHINKMFHANFSDFPYYVIAPVDRWLGLDGPIDARYGHRIVNAYSLAFFDRYLKEYPAPAAPLLDCPDRQFAEVICERKERRR
jgi:predicted dienelactone hydrolase